MRFIAVTIIVGMLSYPAHSAAILCPETIPEAPTTASETEKWQPQYAGSLLEVTLARTYREGKYLFSTLLCERSTGVISMTTKKACRLIEGGGKMSMNPITDTEFFACKMPKMSFTRSNDKICRVLCSD